MVLDFSPLKRAHRLLVEAVLRPVQGQRFQPTGFPNLGHAAYASPDGNGQTVLIESAQSMANRLEAVCWDVALRDWVSPLRGLPFVRVLDPEERTLTTSVEEAHRLNSAYVLAGQDNEILKELKERLTESGQTEFNRLARVVFEFDPNSLIHGVFLEKVSGRLRIPRSLSAFVEAENAQPADSGGVKNDVVEPKKTKESDTGSRTAKEGFGNVPFPRREWIAEQITAYFNLDIQQVRAFGLGSEAEDLLIALALFKIRAFLSGGLRLRTACDLDVHGDPCVTRPEGFALPDLDELEGALPRLIEAVRAQGLFGDTPVRTVTYRK